MRNLSVTLFCVALIVGAFLWPVSAQDPATDKPAADKPAEQPAANELKTENEKILYTLGLALGRNDG